MIIPVQYYSFDATIRCLDVSAPDGRRQRKISRLWKELRPEQVRPRRKRVLGYPIWVVVVFVVVVVGKKK